MSALLKLIFKIVPKHWDITVLHCRQNILLVEATGYRTFISINNNCIIGVVWGVDLQSRRFDLRHPDSIAEIKQLLHKIEDTQ